MSKANKVISFYVMCNKLKNIIRKGWIDWNVKRERLESVAEHIYGVQMLAIAIASEYDYHIDIKKVIYMLAIHELEEIIIGDLTMFDINKEEKLKIGNKALNKILGQLIAKDEILALTSEYNERKTKEAMFAYWCDKLECDLQSKLYDEEGCVDLKEVKNKEMESPEVQKLLKTDMSWGQMWITFSENRYNYDKNFLEILKFAKENKINE